MTTPRRPAFLRQKPKPRRDVIRNDDHRAGSGLAQYRKDRNRYWRARATRVIVTYTVCIIIGRTILQDALGGPHTIASWAYPAIGSLLVTASADHFAETLWQQIRPLPKRDYLHKPTKNPNLAQQQLHARQRWAAKHNDSHALDTTPPPTAIQTPQNQQKAPGLR